MTAPTTLGTHSIRLYDEVECQDPRLCEEVVEDKPDIIVVTGTLVGSATTVEMRTAIALVVGEDPANIIQVLVLPGADPCAGQSNCFRFEATVLPSTSNETLQAVMVASLQVCTLACVWLVL